jgi:hypothetical protein
VKLWVFLFVAWSAFAADLETIRQTQAKLITLRPKGDITYPLPDPPPELAELKHQIRDWAEEKIAKLRRDVDLAGATSQIDGELSLAQIKHGDEPDLGDIEGIRLEHAKGDESWMALETTVVEGLCTRNTSVYLYEWQRGGWTRRFELEERIEGVGHVEVGALDAYQNRFVLVLGNSFGCASNWQQLSYRIFRIGSEQQEVLSGEETFFDFEYQGKLEPSGALIEFAGEGIEGGFVSRHVLHYAIEGNVAKRIEPIALLPQDYVEEWIRANRQQWSWQLDLVQRCPGNAARWQVGASRDGDDDSTLFFLVDDLGDHRYRFQGVSEERQPGCPGNDGPDYDAPLPTLFPKEP